MSSGNYNYTELTEEVISAFYKVYNVLGYGFLEKVYENALYLELKEMNFDVEQQKPIEVKYEGQSVGSYFADLVVDRTIINELKAAEKLIEDHEFQLINYLKATDMEVGLLLNFGKKPEIRRKVFSAQYKSKERS